MLRRLLGFSILLLAATPLLAVEASWYVKIDQPSPDSRTFITATVRGAITCAQLQPTVTVSGNTITIRAEYLNGVCIATWVPVPVTARIGTLKGGVYDVVGKNMTWDGDVHTKLVVRDIDPMHVYPPGGTIAGGTKVRIEYDGALDTHGPLTVTFDGLPATDIIRYATAVVCTAPPHAAGDVNVVVAFHDPDAGSTQVDTYAMKAAYRYFDPSSAPDPFLVERLLFPLKYESVGAYGSQWTTDSVLAVPYWTAPGFVDFWYPPCSTCSTRIEMSMPETIVRLDKGNAAAGTLLYVMRGTLEAARPSSRIHDVSKQAESAGTDIPIVRERDFIPSVKLYNVPVDPRYRAMLRVWLLVNNPGAVTAYVRSGNSSESIPLTFSPPTIESLAFASADLTPLFAKFPTGATAAVYVDSYDTPLWAMLSITNNDTQEVTILVPH